jgi:DNA-binding response OmpR family regulator
MRILVVEDEYKVANALQEGLQNEGYTVEIARTGEDGFFRINEQTYDLVLLDLMLPERDGFEVLQALRKQDNQIPVLVLTARDAIEDRVRGLNAGADDYLVKPFAFAELLARIHALLRRGYGNQVLKLAISDLEMDLVTHRVTRQSTPLELTVKEFELLEYLLRNQGRIVSREMLTLDVWKQPARAVPLDNVIDVHVARLRRKIDTPFDNKLLHTVRGVGFILKEE